MSGPPPTAVVRRVLVTGLGTFWGGRVAQALEADPSVEVIVGLDTTSPTVALLYSKIADAVQQIVTNRGT